MDSSALKRITATADGRRAVGLYLSAPGIGKRDLLFLGRACLYCQQFPGFDSDQRVPGPRRTSGKALLETDISIVREGKEDRRQSDSVFLRRSTETYGFG